MDIKLNFINQSNDANNSSIVIFSKNTAVDFSELAIAWQVIKNCGQGENHPFSYTSTTQVAMGDSWGNYSPRLDARLGESFAAKLTPSGDQLFQDGASVNPDEIEVSNDLEQGSINAHIYKAGKLFAQKTSIAPGQKAVFAFEPTIWIGVASQIEEGQIMNAAILSNINTELSLLGVASADIVMTGGGPGANSTPFEFQLSNVVMA